MLVVVLDGAVQRWRGRFTSRLNGERRPAPAGGGDIGVADDELGSLESLLVVDLGADEVLEGHRVDDDGDAHFAEDGVVVGLLVVKGEAVLEAGASAAGDEDAEFEVGVSLLVHQVFDFACGVVGEDDDGVVGRGFGMGGAVGDGSGGGGFAHWGGLGGIGGILQYFRLVVKNSDAATIFRKPPHDTIMPQNRRI